MNIIEGIAVVAGVRSGDSPHVVGPEEKFDSFGAKLVKQTGQGGDNHEKDQTGAHDPPGMENFPPLPVEQQMGAGGKAGITNPTGPFASIESPIPAIPRLKWIDFLFLK